MTSTHPDIDFETVPCPLCDHDHCKHTATFDDWIYGIGGPFHAVRCCRCGHRYLNPRPVEQDLLKCYPLHYGPHHHSPQPDFDRACEAATSNPRKTTESSPINRQEGQAQSPCSARASLFRRSWRAWLDNRSTWKPTDRIRRELRNQRAIELGCADGWFCAELMNDGWNIMGVEPVAEAADRARRKGIQVVTGSAFDLQIEPNSIGYVAAWMVMEHLSNPLATISRVAEWLESGGYFAFSVPNFACLEVTICGKYWSGYDGGRHLQFFSPSSVRRMLKVGGLQVQQIQFQNTVQPWLGALGSWCHHRSPNSGIVQRIRNLYMDEIPFGWRVALTPFTNFLAHFRLASRMTIIARKTS